MSPLVPLLCLCLSLPAQDADRWAGEDKLRHFLASFVATSVGASAARAAGLDPHASAWAGAGFGVTLGLLKEARDAGTAGATASPKDLAWDLVGVAAATALARQAR